MNIIGSLLTENLVEALGWTMLHSLWQGLAVGVVLFPFLRFARGLSSSGRYLIMVAGMFAIPLAAAITFLSIYAPEGTVTTETGTIASGFGFNTADPGSYEDIHLVTLPGRLLSAFQWMISAWMLGVLFFSAKLSGGLFRIARLKRDASQVMDTEWNSRLSRLSVIAGIRRGIRLLESSRIQLPMVAGIIKPVLLMPLSMLNHLPVSQIESIIYHELAHIKRYDFLVNILQAIVENLFFYHPAVWIISGSIRREREKCCDDFAVRHSGPASTYARALAGITEIQLSGHISSVALARNKNQIFIRVERLLNQKKMKNNVHEKWVAGLVAMTSALIILFGTGAAIDRVTSLADPVTEQQEPADPAPVIDINPVLIPSPVREPESIVEPVPRIDPAVPPVPEVIPVPQADSLGNLEIKDNTITRNAQSGNGKEQQMKFVIRKGKVTELYVEGERIPDDQVAGYQEEIDATLEDLSRMEQELITARNELENIDMERIREEIRQEMEHFYQYDMQEWREEFSQLQFEMQENFDKEALRREIEEAMRELDIDKEEIRRQMEEAREEIQRAMEDARFNTGEWKRQQIERETELKEKKERIAELEKALESERNEERKRELNEELQELEQEIQDHWSNNQVHTYAISEEDFAEAMKKMEEAMVKARQKMQEFDEQRIQEIMEKSMKKIEEIDYEAIQKKMQEAMERFAQTDIVEMEEKMKKSLENLNIDQINIEERTKDLDELIGELEKLELKGD